jgi:plastocyanin
MRIHTRKVMAVVAAAFVLGLGACGDDDGDDTADDAGGNGAATTADDAGSAGLSGSDEDEIVIENLAFKVKGPVKQNKAVSINNKDDVEHTVTMDEEGGFDVRVPGGEGEVFVAIQAPGSYAFHCDIHPSMKGTLVIE